MASSSWSFPRSLFQLTFKFLTRPSLWVGIVTILAYWDDTALHGSFVYDDAGSVIRNVVVTSQIDNSWVELFKRDFWGTSLTEISSHKSFRPITTLTFKLNYMWSEQDTYTYHVVNVLLHGLNALLVSECAAFVFLQDTLAQVLTGLLFGLHPVHAEAVSNITSRGELLMSLFCLLAFMSFASHLNAEGRASRVRSIVFIYVFPFVLMALSLFSKEQGATTLICLVVYDFLKHHESLRHYCVSLFYKRDKKAIEFLQRTGILALETLSMCALRYWFNGETSPDFIFDQNPAGFSEDRFTRVFSVNWVYCLYIRDIVYPEKLGPDWSGRSIKLIESWRDRRVLRVLALWVFVGGCLYSLVMGPPERASQMFKDTRRILLTAFWAFVVSPFLLSSNLLVVVGLMKADRVIYLPLLGVCMMEALLVKRFLQADKRMSPSNNNILAQSGVKWWGHVLLLTQLLYYCRRLHERNFAWSHSLRLWHFAHEINSRSYHTSYNYGYELSLVKNYERSEQILRPIGSARVDGPSNTFVYAMVLFNLNRCDEANKYLEEAFEVLEERAKAGGPRNSPQTIARYKSNLLVAKSHCAPDLNERGQLLYQAVQTDQSNTYAAQQAKSLLDKIEMLKSR
jgi:hypothetical protein